MMSANNMPSVTGAAHPVVMGKISLKKEGSACLS